MQFLCIIQFNTIHCNFMQYLAIAKWKRRFRNACHKIDHAHRIGISTPKRANITPIILRLFRYADRMVGTWGLLRNSVISKFGCKEHLKQKTEFDFKNVWTVDGVVIYLGKILRRLQTRIDELKLVPCLLENPMGKKLSFYFFSHSSIFLFLLLEMFFQRLILFLYLWKFNIVYHKVIFLS